MADIVDLRTCDDPRDLIHRVVERLAAGKLVGLPLDTSYAAAALVTQPAAVELLREAGTAPLAISVRGPDEALDFAPDLDELGERLIRRLWPGPVQFEVPCGRETGLGEALPAKVREAVVRDGHLRLAMPDHDVPAAAQRLNAAPLVLSATPAGRVIGSPAALAELHGDSLELIVEDGPPLHPGHPTVVRIGRGGWTVVAQGLLDETAIRERMNFGIVFVCTGNTCRSPLAEAIFRKLLAERLNCAEGELAGRGFSVTSAGLAAGHGMPAAAESLVIADEFGLSLAVHRSRPLTDDLLDRSDYVVTMTAGHRESILAARPDVAGRVHLLSREGLDIADPIGGGPAEYERCRSEIERELLVLLEHLPIDPNTTRG